MPCQISSRKRRRPLEKNNGTEGTRPTRALYTSTSPLTCVLYSAEHEYGLCVLTFTDFVNS